MISGANRKFNPQWFKEHTNWLEYRISKDVAYCLCYLFKNKDGHQGEGESFVIEGFTNWKKGPERLRARVGKHNSVRETCVKACQDYKDFITQLDGP